MKFGFVAKHRGAWPVNLMCEALGVSRGGFYAWLARPRSLRNLSDEVLGAQVHQSFVRSDRTYGARRAWHDVLEQGQTCGLHRIERLMREHWQFPPLRPLLTCSRKRFDLSASVSPIGNERQDQPLFEMARTRMAVLADFPRF